MFELDKLLKENAAHTLLAGPHELRIDQYQRLIALLGHIDHKQALVHVNLRRGKANAIEVKEGRLQGAADPRSEGKAISE